MTELEIAAAVAKGEQAAPAPVGKSFLVPMRISGTGIAYRRAKDELCYRPPEIWLAPEMQRRALGLPVILEHPKHGSLVTEDDVDETFLGIIVYAYVKSDELWGVARIFSETVAATLAEGSGDDFTTDTSPAVSFAPGARFAALRIDGARVLVEHTPALIDHLAVIITPADVPGGVWSKGSMDQLGIVPGDIETKEETNG